MAYMLFVDYIAIEKAMADTILYAVLVLFRITNIWPKRTPMVKIPGAALKLGNKIICWMTASKPVCWMTASKPVC